jgi:hypothetical protein
MDLTWEGDLLSRSMFLGDVDVYVRSILLRIYFLRLQYCVHVPSNPYPL